MPIKETESYFSNNNSPGSKRKDYHKNSSISVYLSKSLLNFTGIAYKVCRQGFVESKVCRCCSKENEEDTLHMLFCSNEDYSNYRTKVISTL